MKKYIYILLLFIFYIIGIYSISKNIISTDRKQYLSTAPNTYIITFDSNGNGTYKPLIRYYNERLGKLPVISKEGYTFDGWYYNNDLVTNNTLVKSDMKLTAKLSINNYKLIIEDEQYVNTNTKSGLYPYNTQIDLEAVNRVGYKFIEWTSKTKDKNISFKITKDTTIKPLYEANTYTIIFNKNSINATGYMNNILVNYDEELELPENKYLNEGYKFIGWNTKQDGTGDIYSDKAIISNLIETGTITLYAQWKKLTTADFISGKDLNTTMKLLAGTQANYSTLDTNIESILYYPNPSSSILDNAAIVSIPESEEDIYMWYDNNTIYYYSYADIMYLNKDSSYTFNALKNVQRIDTNFYTDKVLDMQQLFYKCENLNSLDLSNFNTSKVTNMRSMFSECFSLNNLDLSSFNTTNVKNYTYMFNQCYDLENLDLSSFNTSNATNMKNMFSSSKSIKKLDISNFNTSKVTNMEKMFDNMSSLTTIYVSELFTTNIVTKHDRMFINDYLLVGGQGTVYNVNNINKEYAHIDEGINNPGYFTLK